MKLQLKKIINIAVIFLFIGITDAHTTKQKNLYTKRHYKDKIVTKCGKEIHKALGKKSDQKIESIERVEIRILNGYQIVLQYKRRGRLKQLKINNAKCMVTLVIKNVKEVAINP